MNAFSEFLFNLRKEKGLTQANLADMLGVTNKAVSKWERGEAMPETAQLLPLSRILGVTVDELLNGSYAKKPPSEEVATTQNTVFDKKTKNVKWKKLSALTCAVVVALGVLAYLILGFVWELWYPYWVLTVLAGTSCVVIEIVFEFFDKERCKWEMSHGKNVYTEGAGKILMMVCVNVYLFCGVFANLWHPLWVVFPIGGVVAGVVSAIGHFFAKGEREDEE
ncbi:MAG: helix-turn-helix transcriptional regulator [Clostridia bacterium]|nr:helix-turn-helix transcriptional regulator [Clostridia bacterium]